MPTDKEQLKNELEEAEKAGLIEKELVNKKDEQELARESLLPFFKS